MELDGFALDLKEAYTRPPLVRGRSKILYPLSGNQCLVRLIPSLTSFTHRRDEVVPGTETLRLDFYELAATRLAAAGVRTVFRHRVAADAYVAELCSNPPFETIVKNVATGSTTRKYPELFPEGHVFQRPVVKFDFRNDLEDQPIADDYVREAGLDPKALKRIALRINELLKSWLAPRNLVDFCLVIGESVSGELLITSEISPDCMRLKDVDGSSLDKDLFRFGASGSEIVRVWGELARDIAEGA